MLLKIFFKKKFSQKCKWDSNTVEEFKTGWKDDIEKVQLDDNERLHGIYEIISKRVPKHVNFGRIYEGFKETYIL